MSPAVPARPTRSDHPSRGSAGPARPSAPQAGEPAASAAAPSELTPTRRYHHGDLRAALLESAREMLDAGETFSLRAVARRAGVSPTAPYRHFADRDALESALAVQGFEDLTAQLAAVPARENPDHIADLANVYVDFALERPAVFRLMFGQECDTTDDARARASAVLHEVLGERLQASLPAPLSPELGDALWALAHGLAFLHLDRKMPPTPVEQRHRRVRDAYAAIITDRSL